MFYAPALAAAAETSDSGNAFLGFLMIIGGLWFIGWLLTDKPKDIHFKSETRGVIKRK